MQRLKQKIPLIVFLLILFNPIVVMAQGVTSGPPTYQGVDGSIKEYLCSPDTTNYDRALEQCVNKIYRFGISFGAIALVFFVVFAGYMYMVGGEAGKGKAKGILQNALVGMGILLFSYVLLRFINPNLVMYKPIQPPMFSSADLPTCEGLGLGKSCVPAGDYYDNAGLASSSGCKSTFASESEAKANMTTFNVTVWTGTASSKTASQKSVTVQKCMEAKVKSVFQQIYNSPEKPLIKNLGSFTWRTAVGGGGKLSTHSFGLTFDINWEENYYIKGGKTVGNYWKPCPVSGCDVFSLPKDGIVVKTFKAAGFGWGGEWNSLKDYMHFSCHPKEQGKCF